MNIIKIRGDDVYCFVDETFIIFSANALITDAEYVGHAWAVGKIPWERRLENLQSIIKKNTCYHNMIVMALLKSQGYEIKKGGQNNVKD